MPDFAETRRQLEAARGQREAAVDHQQRARARLAAADARIAALRRSGAVRGPRDVPMAVTPAGAAALAERDELRIEAAAAAATAAELRAAAEDLSTLFAGLGDPRELVAQLDNRTPFLLLPLRVETRFVRDDTDGPQLWVRIFPDDIAVETHEPELTDEEVHAGRVHWEEVWRAGGDVERERAAWRVLARLFGVQRAAWIAATMRPTNADADWPSAPLDPGTPLAPEPSFPDPPRKEAGWTRVPQARVLPDRFAVALYRGGQLVTEALGRRVPDPLVLGPDPLRRDGGFGQEGVELRVDGDMEWLTDFARAEGAGMALRIGIGEQDFRDGFDRVIALGLRLSSSAEDGRQRLERLLASHRFTDGLALLSQGTPTNNTGAGPSGFDFQGPGEDEAFDAERGAPQFRAVAIEHDKSDGQRLAEALGISIETLGRVPGAGGFDLREAEAMNRALWRGTIGYFLEEMMAPVVSVADQGRVRAFFTRHVRGRGTLPALRIGVQPYGVLPATAWSRWTLDGQDADELSGVFRIVRSLEPTWRRFGAEVPRVGAGADPGATLLSILGLHAASVEFHGRRVVGPDYLYNLMVFGGGGDAAPRWNQFLFEAAAELLAELGYPVRGPESVPRILTMALFRDQIRLNGPLIDDGPLSERDPIRPIDEAIGNYLRWMVVAPSLDAIRDQDFGRDAAGHPRQPPAALLYLLMRHAVLANYWDAAMGLHESEGTVDRSVRREIELVNMGETPNVLRWDFLDRPVASVTGLTPVKDFLVRTDLAVSGRGEVLELAEARAALSDLADLPTARLERLLVEHLDLASHRLDAWIQGFLHRRLLRNRADGEVRHGIYLGAFGWVENLRPRQATERVPNDDPAAVALGGAAALPGRGPLVTRPSSGGFVHAPSIGQAKAAAVLRAGYLGRGAGEEAAELAINLSSERVRRALEYGEGIRSGQSLGALLGYRFERGVHDRTPALALDQFIFAIRRRYPLLADQLHPADASAPIDALEARNVVDGAALVEASRTLGYPYDVPDLPPPDSPPGRAIREEVDRIADSLDAVADLGLAESVFQVVQGNYDRARAVLEAASRGGRPVESELIETPRSGIGLTHRVGILFQADAPPVSPWAGIPLTPRARAEPRINAWLGARLGDPTRTVCRVRLGEGASAAAVAVHLGELGIQPLDLVLLAGADLAEGAAELERRIVSAARLLGGVADQLPATVLWFDRQGLGGPDERTFFELMPLLRALRELITGGRALDGEDFRSLTDEVPEGTDTRRHDLPELEARVADARALLGGAITTLAQARDNVAAMAPPDAATLDALRAALGAASLFGLPDAVPRSMTALSTEAAAGLVAQADAAGQLLRTRAGAVDALLAAGGAGRADVRLADAVAAIFGRSMRVVPRFSIARASETNLAAGATGTLLADAPPLAVDEWLQGTARVRERMAAHERVRLVSDLFGTAPPEPTPLQLPYVEDDRWLAARLSPGRAPRPGVISLVLELPPDFDAASPQAGLLIDEWVEVIPGSDETTGLTFHFDQPNAEPPQTLLLVLPPVPTGRWAWADLIEALHETLEAARMRAVEPDQLGRSVLSQFLPMVTPAVAPSAATIVADLTSNVRHRRRP
jgi:hypothetical protein